MEEYTFYLRYNRRIHYYGYLSKLFKIQSFAKIKNEIGDRNINTKIQIRRSDYCEYKDIIIKTLFQDLTDDGPNNNDIIRENKNEADLTNFFEKLNTNIDEDTVSNQMVLDNFVSPETSTTSASKSTWSLGKNENIKTIGWGGIKLEKKHKIPHMKLLKDNGLFKNEPMDYTFGKVDEVPKGDNLVGHWVYKKEETESELKSANLIPCNYNIGIILINPVGKLDLKTNLTGKTCPTFINLEKEIKVFEKKSLYITDYFPYWTEDYEIPIFENHKDVINDQVIRILNSAPKILILAGKETQNSFYRINEKKNYISKNLKGIFGVPSFLTKKNTIIFMIHHPSISNNKLYLSNTKFIFNLAYIILNEQSNSYDRSNEMLTKIYEDHLVNQPQKEQEQAPQAPAQAPAPAPQEPAQAPAPAPQEPAPQAQAPQAPAPAPQEPAPQAPAPQAPAPPAPQAQAPQALPLLPLPLPLPPQAQHNACLSPGRNGKLHRNDYGNQCKGRGANREPFQNVDPQNYPNRDRCKICYPNNQLAI